MKEILEKILEDCDPDIGEFVMADSKEEKSRGENGKTFYKNWELMWEPNICIVLWQTLRMMKRNETHSRMQQ